jgi:hypothetical protein
MIPSGKTVHRSLSSSKLPSTKQAEVEKSATNPLSKDCLSVGLTTEKISSIFCRPRILLLPTYNVTLVYNRG